MGQIVFIGLGLHDDHGISLNGLEEVRAADKVFAEFYTNLLPEFSLERFESLAGKKLTLLSRRDLEDMNGQTVLEVGCGTGFFTIPASGFIFTVTDEGK